MKRLSLLLGFLLLSLTPFAVAAGSCDPSQIIMLLSSSSNAHGEVWGGSYPIQLCYETIFGQAYVPQGGEDPHACSVGNSNILVKLSATTNAHAEIASNNNYATNVCYGDLACVTQAEACPQGTFVMGISSDTNAHISSVPVQGYLNVCCTPGGNVGTCGNGIKEGLEACDNGASNGVCPAACSATCTLNNCGGGNINSVEWQDPSGNVIIESRVNRTVYLIAKTGFGASTDVTFEIFEDDFALKDSIRVGTNALHGVADSSGLVRVPWKITDADMAAAGFELDGMAEFYFNASRTDDPGKSMRSGLLNTDFSQGGENTAPDAKITSPIHRQIYFMNEDVLFNHSSTDMESGLSVEWTIREDNKKFTQDSFYYQFTTPGLKTVTLRVTDEGGKWDEDQVAILVTGVPGILGFINTPFHLKIVNGTNRVLSYSANDSYVINTAGIDASRCDGSITCLAGNCPIQTVNWPDACTANITVRSTPQLWDSIYFNWSFPDEGVRIEGLGIVKGNLLYGSEGENKKINLTLKYSNSAYGISNLIEKTERMFTLGQCVDNGQSFLLLNDDGSLKEKKSTLTTSACAGQDGNKDTVADNCCPASLPICGDTGCYSDETVVNKCEDYVEKNACNNGDAWKRDTVKYEAPPKCGSHYLGSLVECQCLWTNSNTNNGNYCVFDKSTRGDGSDGNDINDEFDSCVITSNEGQCVNGYMTVDITREYLGEGDAEEHGCWPAQEQIIVPCGRPTIELSFFGWQQFVISLIMIAVAYFIIQHRKKR